VFAATQRWWDRMAMILEWNKGQTINDDLVLLLYDDFFIFVITFHAKPPSHLTYDEDGNFVTECSHFVTN